MMLSRAKPAVGGDVQHTDKRKKKGRKIPKLEELLSQRDFTGAITLLEFKRHVGEQEEDTNLWIGYCAFHLGDYKRALEEYENATKEENCNSDVWVNLACTYFFLGMYKQAEAAGFKASKSRLQNRLLFHLAHKVVFRGGEGALQVLPPLVDVIPEARLNLVIYYLRQDDVQEAYNLIKDLEPTTPQRDHMKIAQQFFQLVGGSASECDTIPGRQCMASCFFLLKQFDDVLIYLNSFKSYFYNDDIFNFNYAQAKAATGNTSEAEEVFLLIQSEKMKNDYIYLSWLARCYIMNKKPRLAWELYLKMETSGESFSLLQLIANDCYKMGQFYYSAKAFDVLERLDPNPQYWEGKRGACVGIFQMILAGREPKETLREVIHLLRSTGNTQVEYIIRIMKKWAKENRVPI
uniref:Intraflagellar transport protein 56 n=1 Tax=Saimiri boliviensis boliviensis TaxID=39432 RepID=A0A2K6SR06_SAIBB